MKLMQAIAGAHYGGAEAFFTRLAVALGRLDSITQRVIIRRGSREASLLRKAGVDFRELPFGGRLDFWTPMALRRHAADFQPDIFVTWMNRASRVAPTGTHVLVGRLGGYYNLKYYERCDHLICNTPDLVRHVQAGGWPEGRSTYLSNFVSPPTAGPCSRSDLGVPEGALLLLGAGRLHRNKAFDVLLTAMVDLPPMWLLLAGSGPQDSELRTLAYDLGVADRVRFLGWRTDVGSLMLTCDIFVCPSRHEPLGNVVLEAWAAKRPVIAAAAAGPRQLIRDGTNGVLVKVDDAPAISAAAKSLSERPADMAALADEGHAAYERDYSEAVVIRRYLDFFERVKGSCAVSLE